jgi:alkylhydroperoxidase family enzyme
MSTYLAPIERPDSLLLRLMFFFMRRKFAKVLTPLSVFSARLPLRFTTFYGKVSKLDKKLKLPAKTALLIREQVASINMCLFCMDASRWFATNQLGESAARFDALGDYETSPLFTDAERAALAYATELTREHGIRPATFERLARYYDEREICEIVWLVASEHLYNMSNVGLDIGSDGLCKLPPERRPQSVEVG